MYNSCAKCNKVSNTFHSVCGCQIQTAFRHVWIFYMVIPGWILPSCHESLVCLWFWSFWRTVLRTTGSHFSLWKYDLFISVCGLRLPRDRWRRAIKTWMSDMWVHTLWGTTYQTMCRVRKAIDLDGCCRCDALSLGAYLPDLHDVFRCVSLSERKCKEENSRCAFCLY